MKKLTILAALMLLVSLSTVFAVRTHQRNLSQLTAQNIEALSNGEGGPWWKEVASAINAFIHAFNSDYYPELLAHTSSCIYSEEVKGEANATVYYKGVTVTIGANGYGRAYFEGNKVDCYDPGQGCLKVKCGE